MEDQFEVCHVVARSHELVGILSSDLSPVDRSQLLLPASFAGGLFRLSQSEGIGKFFDSETVYGIRKSFNFPHSSLYRVKEGSSKPLENDLPYYS